MSAHSLNLCGVLSETKRIINAHSRHFLALSVLFLLPLSFSLVVYPSLSHSPSPLSHYHRSLFFFSSPDLPPIARSHFILATAYALFVAFLSLCATASITHSTFHGFYGRPVKFVSSIKYVLISFLPLIGTLIISKFIMGLIAFGFGGFTMMVYNALALIGVEIDYTNLYFLGFVALITALLLGVLIYLQVEWCLSFVIVVVESKWGFAALRRSASLVRGMRGVALCLILLFESLLGLLGLLCSTVVPSAGGLSSRDWISWAFVFQAVVYTGFMTILMLYSVAATAVLYMYCKALQGELAFEIAEEFAQEYIRLPFDDGKLSHVVYVV
ncbi:uncharacterized protein LOC131025168 [Salvia miltiorrhiza]|uniref:uncharacterized protein LOC131025168 n=1 Tax=Salvia miltiorrhiza TaxID=226208 RepID=UPI0025AB6522|nr:uncharacterized protein LOC131025168 [Salvia miltiorrhiza]XP_057810782.1 uncharacterized protein LOC131025168 [Salvia miltiorrhiza]XP_057810783.1 uncharacterized protein LOC131025168 [Salvia miltiorrhiza]XP_057810784.1 uncharacterized protein LOC131025168 [Salvia miltiorrhiza]